MRIYLAGPIFQCSDQEALGWREWIKGILPEHVFLDPMARDYRGRTDENYEEIVEQDLLEIRSADLVLVNAMRPSWGTAMELWDASNYGVGILAVCKPPVNPWLRYVADRTVDSLLEAAVVIREELA